MVELYLHSPIRINGVLLNDLGAGTTSYFTFLSSALKMVSTFLRLTASREFEHSPVLVYVGNQCRTDRRSPYPRVEYRERGQNAGSNVSTTEIPSVSKIAFTGTVNLQNLK
jgi:hypothetical protein